MRPYIWVLLSLDHALKGLEESRAQASSKWGSSNNYLRAPPIQLCVHPRSWSMVTPTQPIPFQSRGVTTDEISLKHKLSSFQCLNRCPTDPLMKSFQTASNIRAPPTLVMIMRPSVQGQNFHFPPHVLTIVGLRSFRYQFRRSLTKQKTKTVMVTRRGIHVSTHTGTKQKAYV